MNNPEIRKTMISTAKEAIKNDWNYKKGISKVPEAIDKLIEKVGGYEDIKDYINEWYDQDAQDFAENEITAECAKTTNSIYIKLFDEQVRISDHSTSELNRNFRKMVTGSAQRSLYVE